MLIDNNISPEQNILNHINKGLNGLGVAGIELSDISFSLPRAIQPKVDDNLVNEDHPNDTYTHNTELTVISNKTGERYIITYRRINIPKQWKILSSRKSIELEVGDLNNDQVIREAIKKIWDFYDSEVITDIQGTGNTRLYTLKAKENSLLYIEGLSEGRRFYTEDEVSLTITITKKTDGSDSSNPVTPPDDKRIPLPDIINDTLLDPDGTKSNEADGFDYDEEVSS